MAVVDELVTLLGFKVDDDDAKRFSVTLDRIKRGATVAGAAITSAVGAIGAFTTAVSAELDETGKFAASMGVNVESLQELEFAAKRAGGSAQDIRGDLAQLTKSLASPIPGEFNQALQFVFGINPFDEMTGGLKEADKVMLEVADKLEGLDPQKAQIMGSQLGLSEGTIRTLVQGRDAIKELGTEAHALGGIVSVEDTLKAADLQDALTNVSTAVTGLGNRLAVSLMPAMTDTISLVTDWFKENKTLIDQALQGFIGGLVAGFGKFLEIGKKVFSMISNFIPEFDSAGDSMEIFELVSTAVTAALIVATAVAAPFIAKIILIGAAITGAIKLIKDLIKWFQGTGGEFESLRAAITALITAFGSLFSAVGGVLAKVFDSGPAQGFVDFLKELPKIAGDSLASVLNIFTSYLDMITSLFSGDAGALLDAVKGLASSIIDAFSINIDAIAGLADGIIGAFGSAFGKVADMAKSILPSFLFGGDDDKKSAKPGGTAIRDTANTVSNQSNQSNQSVTINIDGSKNPAQTGRSVAQALQNPMARTMQTGSAGAIR